MSDGMTLYPERVVEDGETRYVPFISRNNEVGYRVERPGRRATYIYLNPSNTEDDEEQGPNVFLYMGPDGDPCGNDTPQHWYGLDAGEEDDGMRTGTRAERLTPERARYWLGEQRRFMGERGDSLDGYLAAYLPHGRTAAEIAAIYQADLAYLQRLEIQVAVGGR
jgi:hypothetical protein